MLFADTVCNFLEGTSSFGENVRLIYRHYATLYFVFAVDVSESELGILDLIQVVIRLLLGRHSEPEREWPWCRFSSRPSTNALRMCASWI